jgi:hypothetical protein
MGAQSQKPRRQSLSPPSLPVSLMSKLSFSLGSEERTEANGLSSDLVMHAMEMLRERYNDPDAGETPAFDLTAFGKALAAIQEREERAGRC